ncbi:MAG: hypothetical protein M1836_004567 [Candelina mexicana]|nr:MAG: hypothetical protein M1836_004567 [Candelina mexicana]
MSQPEGKLEKEHQEESEEGDDKPYDVDEEELFTDEDEKLYDLVDEERYNEDESSDFESDGALDLSSPQSDEATVQWSDLPTHPPAVFIEAYNKKRKADAEERGPKAKRTKKAVYPEIYDIRHGEKRKRPAEEDAHSPKRKRTKGGMEKPSAPQRNPFWARMLRRTPQDLAKVVCPNEAEEAAWALLKEEMNFQGDLGAVFEKHAREAWLMDLSRKHREDAKEQLKKAEQVAKEKLKEAERLKSHQDILQLNIEALEDNLTSVSQGNQKRGQDGYARKDEGHQEKGESPKGFTLPISLGIPDWDNQASGYRNVGGFQREGEHGEEETNGSELEENSTGSNEGADKAQGVAVKDYQQKPTVKQARSPHSQNEEDDGDDISDISEHSLGPPTADSTEFELFDTEAAPNAKPPWDDDMKKMADFMRRRNKRHREKEDERTRGRKRLCQGLARPYEEKEEKAMPNAEITEVSVEKASKNVQLSKDAEKIENVKKLGKAKKLEQAKRLEEAKKLEAAKKGINAWAEALRRKSQDAWSAPASAADRQCLSSSSSDSIDYEDDSPWEGCEDSDEDMSDEDRDTEEETDSDNEYDNCGCESCVARRETEVDDENVCFCENCVAQDGAEASINPKSNANVDPGKAPNNHLRVDSQGSKSQKPTIRIQEKPSGELTVLKKDLEAFAEEDRCTEWVQMDNRMRRDIFFTILDAAKARSNEPIWDKILRRMIEISGECEAARRMRSLYDKLPHDPTDTPPIPKPQNEKEPRKQASRNATGSTPQIRYHMERPGGWLFLKQDLEAFVEEERCKEWGQMDFDMRQAVFSAVLNAAEKEPGELVWGKILRRMIGISGNSGAAQRMRYLYSRLPQPQTGVTPRINEETRSQNDPIPPKEAITNAPKTDVEKPLQMFPDRNNNTRSLLVPKKEQTLVEHTCMTWEQATQQVLANLAVLASASQNQNMHFQIATTEPEVRRQVGGFYKFKEDGEQIASTFKKSLDESQYVKNAALKAARSILQRREDEEKLRRHKCVEKEMFRRQERIDSTPFRNAVHRGTTLSHPLDGSSKASPGSSGNASTSLERQQAVEAVQAAIQRASALPVPSMTSFDTGPALTEKASEPNKATSDDAPLSQANDPTWSAPVNQDYSQLVEYAATIKRNRELRLARLGKRKEIDSQVDQDTSKSDQVALDARLAQELQQNEFEFQERYLKLRDAQDRVRPRPQGHQASSSNERPSQPGPKSVDSGTPENNQESNKRSLNRPMMLGSR